MIEWYLNLSLWEAVLVWLKLLLPILWVLLVAVLMSVVVRWFANDVKLPRPKPPVERKPKSDKPTTA